jgi:hypothetical protein
MEGGVGRGGGERGRRRDGRDLIRPWITWPSAKPELYQIVPSRGR